MRLSSSLEVELDFESEEKKPWMYEKTCASRSLPQTLPLPPPPHEIETHELQDGVVFRALTCLEAARVKGRRKAEWET